MRTRSASSDLLFFLRSWFENPMNVAAIAPSGEPLSRLITRDITGIDGPVLELGAGTGVFTRALLQRGLAQRDLILVDNSERFGSLLAERFPDAKIVIGDAAALAPLGVALPQSVGAVVSGLPAAVDAQAEGGGDSRRRVPLPARGWRLPSVYLRVSLPDPAPHARHAGPEGQLRGPRDPQPAAGRRLPHHAQMNGRGAAPQHPRRQEIALPQSAATTPV